MLARLRAGDTAAFDTIYAANRARIFAFLARLSGQRALAEDLLQETFLKLATHAKRLDEDTHVDRWLFTVARNLFLSHRRWVLIDLDRLATLRSAPRTGVDPNTPFDLSAASELERRLETSVLALPIKYREVLLLVAVEGLSPTDAANILGLKPEAVRQRLRRAREMLASKVNIDG